MKILTADFDDGGRKIEPVLVTAQRQKFMPIYVLKHYHKAVPSRGRVWLLAREIAFDSPNDASALLMARNRLLKEFGPLGGLAVITDQDGKRVWEYDWDV